MNTASTESTPQLHRRLAATFTARIDAVPDDAWDRPSPCADWTACDVLAHVIDSQTQFVERAGLEIPPGPVVADDPKAAWTHTRDAVQAILDDPELADREFEGQSGTSTLASAFGSFFAIDLVVHGWDIARATGIDEAIPAADLDMVRSFAAKYESMLRSPGAFGPELDAPTDADEQTKLLRFLGRAA